MVAVFDRFQRDGRVTQEREPDRSSRQADANAEFRNRRPSRDVSPDLEATNNVSPPDKTGVQAQTSEKTKPQPVTAEFKVHPIREPSARISCEIDVIIVQGPGDTWVAPRDCAPTSVNAGEDTKAALNSQGLNTTNKTPQSGPAVEKDVKKTPAESKAGKDRTKRCADIATIAKSLISARVLRFEYPAPLADRERLSLADALREFSTRLHAVRPDDLDRPILFIGCDFGITVIEKFLIYCTKDPVLAESICGPTVGVMFLWESTKQNERPKQEPGYFDIKESRLAWMHKLPPPYSEIDSQKPLQSMDTHLKIFESLHLYHARSRPARPAMALMSMRSDDSDIHIRAVAKIVDNLRIYQLLSAAGKGDEDVVRNLTEKGQNINARDTIGQSALHIAVRQNQVHALRFLLGKYGANVSIQDSENNNALHYAAMYCSDPPSRNQVAQVLVEAGVDRYALDSKGLPAWVAAKSAGVSEDILAMRVPLTGPGRWPVVMKKPPKPPESSAAIQACHDCRATLAEFHLIHGQEKITLQRASVFELLYNNDSGPEKILGAARATELDGDRPTCTWYHLPVNHLGWVDDLFTKMDITPDPLRYDQHEGMQYWSRYMRPQARVFDYLQPKDARVSQDDNKKAPRDLVLYMPYLTFERRWDLKEIRKSLREAEAMPSRKWHDTWTLNRRVKRAKTLAADGDSEDPSGVSEADDFSSNKASLKERASGHSMDQNVPLDALQAWDHDAKKTKLPTTYKLQGSEIEQRQDPLAVEKNLVLGYHMADPAVFHQRRTLDQSHYFMLHDTSKRDRDQVVLRNARKKSGRHPKKVLKKEKYPLVMVDQLWIWVVGDTVVSSFPQKCMQPDFKLVGDLRDRIERDLENNKKRAQILNAYDLVSLVIRHCANIFNHRGPEMESGLKLKDIFEDSVGEVADKQMERFRVFKKQSGVAEKYEKELTELSKDCKHHETLARIFAINKEIDLLDEIKDIRDELNMILRILRDQCLAVSDLLVVLQPEDLIEAPMTPASLQTVQTWQPMSSAQQRARIVTEDNKGGQPGQAPWERASGVLRQGHRTIDTTIRQRIINPNIRDFERMLNQADSSYNELNHLLDLKQKQANAWEARLSRKGAESSSRQSKTIIVFTIVTILFGSLSFITALIDLNVSAFPDSWELGRVVGYIIGISGGLSLVFICFAFGINPMTAITRRALDRVVNGREVETKPDWSSDDEPCNISDSYGSDSLSESSEHTKRIEVHRERKRSRWAASFFRERYPRNPFAVRRRKMPHELDDDDDRSE